MDPRHPTLSYTVNGCRLEAELAAGGAAAALASCRTVVALAACTALALAAGAAWIELAALERAYAVCGGV